MEGRGSLLSSLSLSWMNESISLSLSSIETKDICCISNGYTFCISTTLYIPWVTAMKNTDTNWKRRCFHFLLWDCRETFGLCRWCPIIYAIFCFIPTLWHHVQNIAVFTIYGLPWRHINQTNCSANIFNTFFFNK